MTYIYFIQNTNGLSAAGSNGVASGSIDLNLDVLESTVNHQTTLGRSLTVLTIGTVDVPLPIHTQVIPIDQALADSFWAVGERTSIQQKRTNLERALEEYASIKQAQIAPGIVTLCM